MKHLKLERAMETPYGLFGRLYAPSFSCWTLERPWRDNLPYESCIPAGTYRIALGYYNRGDYPCLELPQVEGRTHILIHAGNLVEHTQGCVLVGTGLGVVHGRWAVVDSRRALQSLLTAFGKDDGRITIC